MTYGGCMSYDVSCLNNDVIKKVYNTNYKRTKNVIAQQEETVKRPRLIDALPVMLKKQSFQFTDKVSAWPFS